MRRVVKLIILKAPVSDEVIPFAYPFDLGLNPLDEEIHLIKSQGNISSNHYVDILFPIHFMYLKLTMRETGEGSIIPP